MRRASLHVCAGEIVGFAGADRRGQSSLLRSIIGCCRPGRRFSSRAGKWRGEPPGVEHQPFLDGARAEGKKIFADMTVRETPCWEATTTGTGRCRWNSCSIAFPRLREVFGSWATSGRRADRCWRWAER